MTKLTLSDIANLSNETSAVATVNANSASIETAIENTLSRDGTSPNQMEAAIDMNSNRVINLPAPISNAEPLRLVDLSTFNGGGTISTIPAGGTTGQTLVKNTGTSYDVSWTGGPGTVVYTSNKLSTLAATTSAELASVISDETGTGLVVFGTAPTLSNPVVGTQTTGDNSTKAASTAFVNSSIASGAVATRTALKAIDTTLKTSAILTEAGRTGAFNFLAGNYSAHITADTNEGVYIKANAIASSAGAWVRDFNFVHYYSRWFGAVNDHTTDNSAIINTIITVSNLVNTLSSAGKQSAAYINIEGGVRFSSTSLSFLPAGNFVFIYLLYFANSNLTKGVSDGGGGTNEYMTLSVNSGYPGDGSGALVAEWSFMAPLHPAIMINVAKNNTGADAHLGSGQVRAPTAAGPARASLNFKDENVLRWRAVYQGYGDNSSKATGLWFQPFRQQVDMANVGSTGWPTIPANGTVITGVTSGAKGIKVGHNGAAIQVNWVSGTFVPGEFITDGVTTSTNGISGGGVAVTSPSQSPLIFGITDKSMSYGVYPGNTVTAAAIGGRLTLCPTDAGVASEHKETVTNPSLLFTNTSGAVPSTGRQVVLNSSNELILVTGATASTTPAGKIGALTVAGFFNNAASVQNVFNLASCVRNSAGNYTLTFSTALASTTYLVFMQVADQRDKCICTVQNTGTLTIQNYDHATLAANDLRGVCNLHIVGGNG